ncbi:hypothetical protein CPB86DRAFT_818794 [Serendipita vermifera]|nr:hypothetical protein CPB86DRAFT_818794 [Serendipita vermifera]
MSGHDNMLLRHVTSSSSNLDCMLQSMELSREGPVRSLSSSSPAKQGAVHCRAVESGHVSAPEMVNQLSMQTHKKIPAILAAIKCFPTDINFSDPATFIDIPFPSALSVSAGRFPGIKRDNVRYFRYMGRSGFTELESRVRDQLSENEKNRMQFYGSAGSGKSYLLAALTIKLIQEGKRVIYIPEAGELIEDFGRVIRSALGLAFYDDPQAYLDINFACDDEALVSFAKRNGDGYLIVDHLEALEIRSGDQNSEAKRRAMERLARLITSHPFLYSSCVNQESSQSLGLHKKGTTVAPLSGALNQEEAIQWLKHVKDQLPNPGLTDEEQEVVDSVTGHVPLLLRPLLEFQGKAFDQGRFLQSEEFDRVGMDIRQFFEDKIQLLHTKQKCDEFARLMGAFLRNSPTLNRDKTLYDQRYFYIQDGYTRYTCGAAAEAMTVLLRDYHSEDFDPIPWYDAVKGTNNPIVKGFIAEQVCLKQISMNGLNVVQPELTKMEAIAFPQDPYWNPQITSKTACRLYYPDKYNYRCIDGIILLLKFEPQEAKEAHFFPMQVTLNKVHKDSEADFYQGIQWPAWKKELENAGFAVKSTFVWIGKGASSSEVKRLRSKKTRHTDMEFETEYLSRYINIAKVDSTLAACLMTD